MAERVKLNKISLREQKQKLGMYQRFLPALEARKQQFLMELAGVRQAIRDEEARLRELLERISVWSSLYRDLQDAIAGSIRIREVTLSVKNVAGLKVPQYCGVVFDDPAYSLFATPYVFEEVVAFTREAISMREAIRILRDQERVLWDGFRKTSQRINLYEQVLIVDCRENIRKITVYLQDQQAASVGVAKVAKRLNQEL
ncbi:MAG: V-type ATP synthase subunit D [Syntrophaceae bacterium PtaU1.Bin231]|nr:MAG: V-type ATP synthase subunit D [Syntrophaceae bacterium PtaU1.Bin231]HOG18582.1 V-type ATP synthase subunit D [Syntrophales bacterium]